MNVTPTISVGFADSYVIRIEMTVVGIKVIADVFNARNVTIERLAESFPHLTLSIVPSLLYQEGSQHYLTQKVSHHIR